MKLLVISLGIILLIPSMVVGICLVDHNPAHPIAAFSYLITEQLNTTGHYYYTTVLLRDGSVWKYNPDRNVWYADFNYNLPISIEAVQFWGYDKFMTFDGRYYLRVVHDWIESQIPNEVGNSEATWGSIKD
jgi:hypothetical protein